MVARFATVSEDLFAEVCGAAGIPCRKLTEDGSRTPDFEIQIGAVRALAEVAEVHANPDERAAYDELEARVRANPDALFTINRVIDGTPGKKVRQLIGQKLPQLRSRALPNTPLVLVLYDDADPAAGAHAKPYDVLVGMYGFETFDIGPVGGPVCTGHKFGPGAATQPRKNTSLSAVMVIRHDEDLRSRLSLDVYHNEHARVPLARGAVESNVVREFARPPADSRFRTWVQIGRGSPTAELRGGS